MNIYRFKFISFRNKADEMKWFRSKWNRFKRIHKLLWRKNYFTKSSKCSFYTNESFLDFDRTNFVLTSRVLCLHTLISFFFKSCCSYFIHTFMISSYMRIGLYILSLIFFSIFSIKFKMLKLSLLTQRNENGKKKNFF